MLGGSVGRGSPAAEGGSGSGGYRNSALPRLIRTFAPPANGRRGRRQPCPGPSARSRSLGPPVPRRVRRSRHELHAVQQGPVLRALGRGQEPGEWARTQPASGRSLERTDASGVALLRPPRAGGARLLSKYDPQKEAELRSWIEGLTGLSIGPDFQKGLKDGVILCTLMNNLQPGSVPKINRSMQNWHQLENLSNFIKAMVGYGMNPVDLFEANDLFESGNMTQVQVSLLALAGKAKTKGLQSGVDIGVKYSEKQERNFDDATMKAGQCVIGLQMGTNKCASQSGMTAYGTRRHLYDPKNHILPPMDHCTISLQMGTNKCASQVGMTAPGTRRHIYDTKLGTDKCDNSSMSLQMGYTQGANQSGQVFGLGRQIYDPKYCPQGPAADGAPVGGDGHGEGPEYLAYCQEEAGY
ncbi:Calponin-2 [Microtus ochrogaster]|uniref:Calponin n=1 Tax=Microtus ochrogaster TaxID=79684 RepID=A0A8J6GIG0_MICOH|nr:Calponin-2 [Microtus ochrogaster]